MSHVIIDINTQKDIITARQNARDMAKDMGFRLADQTRLATAISELTRNVIQYAVKGQCRISDDSDDTHKRVKVEVEDYGPGIPDIEKAMTYGYSTGRGLGAGLPGSKSLVHEFHIESKPGHTKITVSMKRKR